ncbi:arabinan endo-1,5-alpha-L-arabinosidase [Mucilaginibacter terrae]|uniref:Arabinan endo-1,5-alpha-L-arabinosidase n=1 Tax=Mucilaginibacter terrae TaxID=1955052 RepID=A0ABU3GNX0_9SPHI|nr:arabinan endo-1,5-alpha-L-arabinosidase [Mucilaginibacter terrae]MDT3401473.1 arabinan endo-1,5-alpha-L-arabinosidase [Mucilaginibacter terrae]
MKNILLIVTLLFTSISIFAQTQLRTNISVHDPVMIKQDSVFYLFCTGMGIASWSSADMVHWKQEKPVFATPQQWAVEAVPGFKGHIWAPDISYHNGLYYLYYSVSAFGKNTSCIGVATNPTLNTESPAFKWTDHGKLIQSIPGKTNWNAIDPNLAEGKNETPYLTFGSFWGGLKIVKLNKDRLSVAKHSDKLRTVATRVKDDGSRFNAPAIDDNPRDAGGNAIEAPFIFKKDNYYYLFASIDYCCKGPKSTYKMIVARCKNVRGPYLDNNGQRMDRGGGTVVRKGNKDWYGVGHNGVCSADGNDYLVYHGYDAADKGKSKLIINKIDWQNGWPVISNDAKNLAAAN